MATSIHPAWAARRWLSLSLAVGCAIVLVVLIARTVVGAVSEQLAPWQIALLTALECAAAMAAWRLDDEDRLTDQPSSRLARAAAAIVCGLLFGLLLARTSSSGVTAAVVVTMTWSIAGIGRVLRFGESLSMLESAFRGDRSRQHVLPSQPAARSTSQPDVPGNARPMAASAEESVIESELLDESLRIQFQRRTTADGDTIDIQARLEFAAGAREAVLHVPFWPALEADPAIECEPLESDEVELRITSAERYGIRLEGRLPTATVSLRNVPIGIQIRAAADKDEIAAAA